MDAIEHRIIVKVREQSPKRVKREVKSRKYSSIYSNFEFIRNYIN